MPSFKDVNGRDWTVRVDVWSVREVKRETGILLTAVGDDDFALLQRLSDDRDPIDLLTVLWVLLRDQAPEGYSEREFGMGLAGDALANARDALLAGIVDFFSDPAQRRALRTLIDKAQATGRILGDRLTETLTNLDPGQLAESISPAVSSSPG